MMCQMNIIIWIKLCTKLVEIGVAHDKYEKSEHYDLLNNIPGIWSQSS